MTFGASYHQYPNYIAHQKGYLGVLVNGASRNPKLLAFCLSEKAICNKALEIKLYYKDWNEINSSVCCFCHRNAVAFIKTIPDHGLLQD